MGDRHRAYGDLRASGQLRRGDGLLVFWADGRVLICVAATRGGTGCSRDRVSRAWTSLEHFTFHRRGMDCGRKHVRARSQTLVDWSRHRYGRFACILFMACEQQGSNRNMSGSERTKRSVYMEWAKKRSHAKFNLATSGLMGVPRS